MAGQGSSTGPRLHFLEVLTPVVLLAVLGIFALPNYLGFRPRADLRQTVAAVHELLEAAREASADRGIARLRFDPAKRLAVLEVGEARDPAAELELPRTVQFGYGSGISPFPLLLDDGRNLAATEDGVSFDDNAVGFRGGILMGYPGLIYLRTDRGDAEALFVRITGGIESYEWNGQGWRRSTDS